EATDFSICNDIIIDAGCGSLTGEYCLFGFKWGEGNNFSTTGPDATGPMLPGGELTFSFQDEPTTLDLLQEDSVSTLPFSALPEYARDSIRSAFQRWESVADISFVEDSARIDSNIKIYIADVSSGGNGFPRFSDSPCDALNGIIILDPAVSNALTPVVFRAYALHEIGHVMGLGHCQAGNLMSTQSQRTGVTDLQPGDVEGILQIYGN
ncbi:MAG: matrixin family metalloprotease, partial [Bacteroidota bacterium]